MSAPPEPPVACPVLALGDRRFVRTPDLAELAMDGKPLLDDCLGPTARILAAIDNSYSMATWWPRVSAAWNRTAVQIREQWGAAPDAVVFNHGVKQCDELGELNGSHDPGYNTDILAVVRHLRTRMEAGPADVPVSIVFVSDGHHTARIASGKSFQQAFEEELHEMQACRAKLGCRVNVLVIGVGPHFPTWMAMQFRTALHNGNPGLPKVFLVNDNEGIEPRFAEMRDALRSCARPLTAEGFVRLNPAASPTTELFPGLWFELPEGGEQSVTISGRRLELVEGPEQQLQALQSMFEQWVHWADRLALEKRQEDVKAAASQLAPIMQAMLDSTRPRANRPANAFADRLERKTGRTDELMAQQLVRHMKEHATGKPWEGLSDGEMAQRLSLAPDDQNRYLQKLWMRQGCPQAAFPETAASFLREVEQVRWRELEAVGADDDGTLCELTQETLGKSVAGLEFAAALKACPSFYTFLHCWPLAGLGVRFRYYDGVVMNPWSLEVEACCTGGKNLDTTELLGVGTDADGFEVEAGSGQRIMVNAVVPLVTRVSALAYSRLVRSELFQRVVSYSVLKMPDILEPNAHAGALAGVLLHLLQLPCGDGWRDRLLDRVAATASIFACRPALQRHIRCLQADPRRAFCSSTAGDERSEADGVAAQTLAKPLLLMHVMRARGELREIRQVVQLLDAFLTEFVGRAIDCGRVQDWFELEGSRPAGEGVGLDVGAAGVALRDETYLRSFFTESELLKDVRRRMLHAQPLYSEALLAAPARAKLAKLQRFRSHGIRTAGLRGIVDHFLQPCADGDAAAAAADELLSNAAVAARMAHAVKWHGSRDRMQNRVLPWADARRGVQETLLRFAYIERRHKLEDELQEQACTAWTADFRRLHEQNPQPLPLPEVLRQLRATQPQAARKRACQLDYNPQTGLLRNACMVPTCPFFLQPRADFHAHLAHLQLLPDFVPGLHRTAALMRAQPPHAIARAVARGDCLRQEEGAGVSPAPPPPPEAWVASLAAEYLRLEAQGVAVGEAACRPSDVLGHAGRPHRIIPLL